MKHSYKTFLYGMVVSVLLTILTMPFTLILAQSISSSSSAALVVLNTSNLTPQESAVYWSFQDYGMTVTQVAFSGANYDALQGYDLVLATEDQALNTTTINQLIENGKRVILFYTAATPFGGTWRSSTGEAYRQLAMELNQAFFSGYLSSMPFVVQKAGTAWAISDGYPGGWTSIGRSGYASYQTVFYREHGSGGKGVIYTYNPAETSETGKNIVDMMVEWVMGTTIMEGKVLSGSVAFVITRYNDDDLSPDLTPVETALQSKLLGYGHTISYVRFSRLRHSEIYANMVVAAEYPSIDGLSIAEQLPAGRNLALYYTSSASLGGNWSSSAGESYRSLVVVENQAFLRGYKTDLSFLVQKAGTAYTITADFPGGWTALGRNTSNYRTVFFRVDGSGAKGMIFTYNPAETSETGRNIDDLIHEWYAGSPAHEGKVIPEGHVLFVISRYNDNDLAPDLTPEETWLQSRLLAYGYNITYVRFSRLRQSYYMPAHLIVAGEYPSIDQQSVAEMLSNGKKMALYYNSAAPLGGDWRISTAESYRSLSIEQNQAFFSGYAGNLPFVVQNSGSAYCIISDYPGGWTSLGTNTTASYKTIFYRTHVSGARGLIYPYSVGQLSETGRNISDMIYEWFEGTPAHAGKTIDADKVAFVITRYNDDDMAPDLTSVETALQSRLVANGYNLSYVRFSRLRQSDLSQARMVVAAEYPTIDALSINEVLSSGKKLALYYTSGNALGGDWRTSTGENWRSLAFDPGQTLFGFRSSLPFVVQKAGPAYALISGYPGGWTAVGSSAAESYKSLFTRVHLGSGGKGLISTYNPAEINETGKNIDDFIYWWFEGTPAHAGKTVPAGNVAFVISRYNDSDISPDLSSEETALHIWLISHGYNVTFIRSSRLPQSDVSGARLITASDYPTISITGINDYLTAGRKVALFYNSGASLGGNWNSSTGLGYRSLWVDQNQAFVNGLKADIAFETQKAGNAYGIISDYPGGWTSVGSNTAPSYKTALTYSHVSGGRGLIYTYNPAEMSETGKNIFERIYEWLEDTPSLINAAKTVPAGNVAFVISRFNDDDTTPDLTAQETALQSRLLQYGYNITYIRSSRFRHSNTDAARMIVSAEYPAIGLHAVNGKLTGGQHVAMLNNSGVVVGGRWNVANAASYRQFYVEASADFLSAHHVGYQAECQTADNAWCMYADYPGGWRVLARNSNTNHKTAFSFDGAGRGAILTYGMSNSSAEGDTVFVHMLRWLQGMPVDVEREVAELPRHFMLHQNYPNPFNPATTIRYDLPEPGHVQIRIYTITGQMVAMPVNGTVPAGYHTLQLNATRLASGVYLYEIVAEPTDAQSKTYVKTRKMMIIK
jgi:hypothetical protein